MVEGRPLGVEPICSVLQVAPSTYYAAKTRPDWTKAVCRAWLEENTGKATAYICRRGQRHLLKASETAD